MFRLVFVMVLISGFSIVGLSQSQESDETPEIVVPEKAMEQIVRRILSWSFKPRNKPTTIYLAERRIKQSWLPQIKNIEFQLLSVDEIQRRGIKVHFFMNPELSGGAYDIGFVFGNATCEYLGAFWHFRISKQKVKLWPNGNVGGGCSSYRQSP